MSKRIEENKISGSRYIPFILVLIIIPLIVSAKSFENGLVEKAWYSTNTTSYDFFMYYKSRLIMLAGVISAFLLAWSMYQKSSANHKNRKNKANTLTFSLWFLMPLGVYGFFVLLSSLFSENMEFAFFGSIEQFEGGFALLSYLVIAFYGLYFVSQYELEGKIVLWLIIGAFAVSLIGAFQFFSLDFFRTDFARSLMTMFEPELAGKKFTFSFDLGRTYTTLYNPNYVGSYVALLLPFPLVFIMTEKEMGKKIFAAITCIFMVISLIGSESMTGYIALFSMAALLIIMLLPFMKKYVKRFIIGGAIVIITFVLLIIVKQDAFSYGINKIFNPMKNDYAVSSVEAKKNEGVTIYTRGKKLNVKMKAENGKADFDFTDGDGNVLEKSYNPETKRLSVTSSGFEGFAFTASVMQVDNKSMTGFKMEKDGKAWNFVEIDGTYQFLSNYGKAAPIRKIESMGFENLQHFASRRGFIWSRTFPLLGKHLILGSGPDTFVLEFPNDDFVGMVNNDYSGNMVTKPHNMYLQIAVQTGVLSLIAFLVLYVAYFIDCIRIYWKRSYEKKAYIGLACFIGTFGYMITGLANDSTVTVAPIFWLLLGVGAAVNYKLKHENSRMEESGK
ncbi:MAG: O-antigen ligase family protein [Lachnospiraceae bacterium]|nr:O-antigen ligase family protein [Lachnospiraceae bacterium]